MPESLEKIEAPYSASLRALSVIWDQAETKTRFTELIRIFTEAQTQETDKAEFIAEAKQFFNTAQITLIILWIESYLLYGQVFVDMFLRDSETGGSDDENRQSEGTPTTVKPPKDPRGEKIRRTRAQARKQAETKRGNFDSIAELIEGKDPCRFAEMDFEFIYKRIEKEWKKLSKYQRAVTIKEMARFEAQGGKITDEVISKVADKLKFISVEEVAGYVEIGENTKTLRTYARNDRIDLESVRLIGAIRLQFHNVLTDFADEIQSLCGTKANQAADGTIRSSVFTDLRGIVERSNNAIDGMKIGEKYEIDTGSVYSKAYQGHIGNVFTFAKQDDQRFYNQRDLIKTRWQAFFEGSGGRIYVIDIRAVKKTESK